MPDLDRFNRSFGKVWRHPARIINHADTPEFAETAAEATGKALYQYLKDSDGPALAKKFWEVLMDSESKLTPEHKLEVFEQIRILERSAERRNLSGIFGKLCREMIVDSFYGQKTNFTLFLEKACVKIIDFELHSKIDVLHESKSNWQRADFRNSYKEVLQNRYIKLIVNVLTEDTNFKKPLRFPKVKSIKLPTKELLNMPIVLE